MNGWNTVAANKSAPKKKKAGLKKSAPKKKNPLQHPGTSAAAPGARSFGGTTEKSRFATAQKKGKNPYAAKAFSAGKNASGLVAASFAVVDTGNSKTSALGRDFKLALMQARMARKWSQKVLAAKLNVKPNVINQYEQGKVVPNGALIARMNKVLGVKLPKVKKAKRSKSDM